jgi:repressor LexA
VTDRQLEVLEFLRRYQREHGMPPTTREICDEFGFASTNSAACHLRSLEKLGFVTHRPMIARGWIARAPTQTGEVA